MIYFKDTPGLVRLSKKEYNDQFQRGELFMNPLSLFHKIEEPTAEFRGDPLEGLILHAQPSSSATLWIEPYGNPKGEGLEIRGDQMGAPMTLTSDAGNVFCMTRLRHGKNVAFLENPEEAWAQRHPDAKEGEFRPLTARMAILLDARMSNFGDSCLVVTNPDKFVDRIKKACERDVQLGSLRAAKMGPVQYFDPAELSGAGFSHAFMKRSSFSHQHEWRLVVYPKSKDREPYHLSIGSISDISQYIPVENLFSEPVSS